MSVRVCAHVWYLQLTTINFSKKILKSLCFWWNLYFFFLLQCLIFSHLMEHTNWIIIFIAFSFCIQKWVWTQSSVSHQMFLFLRKTRIRIVTLELCCLQNVRHFICMSLGFLIQWWVPKRAHLALCFINVFADFAFGGLVDHAKEKCLTSWIFPCLAIMHFMKNSES